MNYKSPLVSIIIPAYNRELYIYRAIESSLRQTYNNVEVIVIDDGSTDNTLKIAQEYASRDDRVRVFTQSNSGVSEARNHGIREARGEYITFLDSDDWLEDDAVSAMLEAQEKYPDKLIAVNTCIVEAKDNAFLRVPFHDINIQSGLLSLDEFIENFCGMSYLSNFHSCIAKLYRADCGIKFPKNISYSEDAVYVFDYVQHTTGAYYISRPLLNVFQSHESLMRAASYNQSMLDSQIAAYHILEKHANLTDHTLNSLNISRCICFMIALQWSLQLRAPAVEVKRIQDAIKPYMKHYLTCRRFSLRRRGISFLKVYLPAPIMSFLWRPFNIAKSVCKKFTSKTSSGEIIPYW